ncbi:hypothetical protein ACE5IS_00865 [Leptospira wolffii]|uniref:Lipoprotein n=1 Tax=Leptospira wolffii TaxID=409998 RepID=A0ABV5BJD4_9LEPT|nr:hypothetical protein [Leptospira wolffii]TGL49130.1 hypothetical protein EHQ61_11725 [Leptospira wolffii]
MKSFSFIGFLIMSCSQMSWRPAGLAVERGWSENGQNLVQSEVLYEEKDSWNPLTGTTLKKNYKTKFRIYDLSETPNPEGDPPIYSYQVESWVLPGSVYFHSATNRLFWIQGSNDQYGGTERFPAVWSPKGFHSFEPNQFLQKDKTILHFVPSPDGGTAAFILGNTEASPEIRSAVLILADTNGRSSSSDIRYSEFSLPDWQETPDHKIRWSEKSDTLYVRIKDKVFIAKSKSKKLEEAKRFPSCFSPPSNFGPVGISPAGSGGDSDIRRDLEPPPYKKFRDAPMVGTTLKIRDCSSP